MHLVKLSETSTADEFKQVLLSILVAIEYVSTYVSYESSKTESKLNQKKADSVTIQGTITQLRDHVMAFNRRHAEYVDESGKLKVKKNVGGGNSIRKFYDYVKKDDLMVCINLPNHEPIPLSHFRIAAQALGIQESKSKSNAVFLRHINSFVVAQSLIEDAFQYACRYEYRLINQSGKSFTTIDAFLSANSKEKSLKACTVKLLDPLRSPEKPPKPISELPKLDNTDTNILFPKQQSFTVPPDASSISDVPELPEPVTEYYLGHYLNTEFRALLASVTLTWRDGILIGVLLQQKEDLYGKEGIGFREAENGIQKPVDNNPYFVLLRNDPELTPKHVTTAQYQQLTIEKELANGVRWGSYSTIIYRPIDRKPQYVPVTGLIVFQLVEKKPDLDKLTNELANFANLTQKNTVPPENQAQLKSIFSIRYQLQNRVISITRPLCASMTNAWEGLQLLVGRYTRYYIRLVYNRFETSHIEIFPDGTATMTQRSNSGLKHTETESVRGVVQIDDDRIWLHFGYNALTGHEKIRFILDRVKSPSDTTWLQGVYCSETLKKQQIASGRTMLVKRPDQEVAWPPFLEKDPDDLTLTDFKRIDSEQPERVLRFFTEETTLGKPSDGPIWAGVARRLAEHSAIDLLDALCQKNKPYDNNQFYYYAFKKETPNEQQFVIERNLVTFHANGKVTIYANRESYSGYAYHYRKTLRLSLYNASDGFLEVFFDLDHNTTGLGNINVLYGVSVWHSPKRIQGKMVVLSRYGYKPGNFQSAIELYRFTPDAEKARLEAEDKRTGGVLSYLRGNLHRYLHTTTQSSTQAVRPRDQTYREVNFIMACYYGILINSKRTDHARRKPNQLLKKCRGHIHESYIHGYGCNFAGLMLPIDFSRSIEQEAISQAVAEAYYTSHFLDADLEPALREQKLSEEPALTTVARIREIAGEQRYFVWAFSPGGPLDRYDLREYARPFWPELMKEVDKQMRVKPFDDGPPDYAA